MSPRDKLIAEMRNLLGVYTDQDVFQVQRPFVEELLRAAEDTHGRNCEALLRRICAAKTTAGLANEVERAKSYLQAHPASVLRFGEET